MKLIVALLLCVMVFSVIPVQRVSADHHGRYTVTAASGVRMRARPTTASRIIRIVPSGARVTVWMHSGSWLKFSYGGNTGWTRQEFLTRGYLAPAAPSAPTYATCFPNSWGAVVCAPDWIAANIWNAAHYYGVSYTTLMLLAACESDYVYDLVSWAGAVGIFQWIPSTWAWIGAGDIWSVRDQSYATARAIAWGYQWHWDCWPRVV